MPQNKEILLLLLFLLLHIPGFGRVKIGQISASFRGSRKGIFLHLQVSQPHLKKINSGTENSHSND
jgi:hypothetical protein